jgi:hypothetical protein
MKYGLYVRKPYKMLVEEHGVCDQYAEFAREVKELKG